MMMLTLAACDSATGPRHDLSIAQRRWSQRAPTSYSITVRRGCFCPTEAIGPVIVTVNDGVVTSRVYASTGQSVPSQFELAFPDVPGLFASVETGLERGYYQLDVEYDEMLGFPKRVSADIEKNIADDEFSLLVTDFTSR